MSSNQLLDRRVFYPGEVIFKEGETGRRFAFLVETGKVVISKATPSGPKIIGYAQQGDIFGEMALLGDSPRPATAKAEEMSSVTVIPETMLGQKLRSSDPFIRALFNIFARNIRDLSSKVSDK